MKQNTSINNSLVFLQLIDILWYMATTDYEVTYNFLARYAVAASSLSPPLASIWGHGARPPVERCGLRSQPLRLAITWGDRGFREEGNREGETNTRSTGVCGSTGGRRVEPCEATQQMVMEANRRDTCRSHHHHASWQRGGCKRWSQNHSWNSNLRLRWMSDALSTCLLGDLVVGKR